MRRQALKRPLGPCPRISSGNRRAFPIFPPLPYDGQNAEASPTKSGLISPRPLNSMPSEEENGSGSGKHCALLRLLTTRAHSPKDEKLPIPSRSMGNPQKLSIYDKMRVQQHRILQFGTRRLRAAIISHLAHFRGREGGRP